MPHEMNTALLNTWVSEIELQPAWRSRADKEMDFCDGNQLDSDVLARQNALGIPPAIENVMGEVFDDILGMEAKNRRDLRVLPDGDKSGDEVAKALGYKLNQAERKSGMDRACSASYEPQVKCGLGWIEVSRESNPFKYPYRVKYVNRNKIWWDMQSTEMDLSDARYLIRREWTEVDKIVGMFPGKEELIREVGKGNSWFGHNMGDLAQEGGASTGLGMALEYERGWTVEEAEWRNVTEGKCCLYEVWYRVWNEALVLITQNGRVIEYDRTDPLHLQAISAGMTLQKANIDKVRRAWFIGPYMLHDGHSPYRNNKFPYVPFFGKREDRTGVPFGLARSMMYLQEEVNARTSKQQWLLSARRTKRTKGAVAMKDEHFRQMMARPDADVILDPEHMKDGGIFEVENDFSLNTQQANRLIEAREAIRRAGRVTEAFQGRSQDMSGVAQSTAIEQTVQGLADINDNFVFARSQVGELLLDLILEDIQGQQEDVQISGGPIKEDMLVTLNKPTYDPLSGIQYLTNDTERTKLKVVLEDVPSTPTFRTQQLQAMTELTKSLPDNIQSAVLPWTMALMDIPDKDDVIKAVQESISQESPEEVEARIKEEVANALKQSGMELKLRELEMKERKVKAEIDHIDMKKVLDGIEAIYSSIQSAREVVATPGVAPVADQIGKSAGFQDQDQPPIVAEPDMPILDEPPPEVQQNTSPMFPPRVQEPDLQQPAQEEMSQPENPGVGMKEGIEAEGAQ